MPGGRKVIYIGGRRASVPDDQFESLMQQLDKDGVQFSTDAPVEAGSPDEPGFNPWKGPEQIPISEGDREDVNGSLRRDLVDTGRGFAQGALGGGADELVDVFGGNRDVARAQDATSAERSPWLYQGAKALGGLPRNLATGFRGALVHGGAEGVLGGNPDDLEGGLKAAGAGAATAGAMYGMGQGMGLTAQAAKGASGALGSVANEARNAALGGTPADYRKLALDRGLDYAHDGPAQAAESLGLTNRLMPQSPRAYAEKAGAVRQAQGQEIGSALDDAGMDPRTHVLRDDLSQALGQRGAISRDGTTRGDALSSSYDNMQGLLARDRPPVFTPEMLNQQKTAYNDQGFKDGAVADMPGSIGAETARGGGQAARELLLGGLQNTPNELARYQGAAQKFGDASMVEDMARNRAASNQAPPQGLGFFGTMTQPATRALKNYGPDLAANVATLGRDATGGMGNMAQAAAPYARGIAAGATPAATQGMGRMAAGADDNPPGDPLAAGRGYLLPQVVADLARTNPQALGPYYQQIAESMKGGTDASQLNALLERLERDQQWSQNYLPQLRARTAEGRGY